MHLTITTTFFTISTLSIDLLKIKLKSGDDVLTVSSLLLPSTCFNVEMFDLFLEFLIFLVYAFYFSFFLLDFLKDLVLNK